jgi:hypothetical protein
MALIEEARPMAATKQEPTTDPFDLEALRVDADDAAVERVVLTVPVRRPRKQEFFRVHPAGDYTLDSWVYEREDGLDREVYLVAPALRAELVDVCRRVRIFTCLSKRGVLFLWPARIPDADGAGRPWHASALEIAEEAKKSWVRMHGNRDLGAYELFRARGDLGEPVWPDESFQDLIRLAFRERLIDSVHHDVIRELHGEL